MFNPFPRDVTRNYVFPRLEFFSAVNAEWWFFRSRFMPFPVVFREFPFFHAHFSTTLTTNSLSPFTWSLTFIPGCHPSSDTNHFGMLIRRPRPSPLSMSFKTEFRPMVAHSKLQYFLYPKNTLPQTGHILGFFRLSTPIYFQ